MKTQLKKEKMKTTKSMYEIYYFNFSNNNCLELGCLYYGTHDSAYDITIAHQHIGLDYFAVVKDDEFVYLSDNYFTSEFLWKEILYYRHFEDFVLIKDKKEELKIRN